MTCYIISFETKTEVAKTTLTDAIKAYASYCPVNATCWAIVTDETASQIRDKLGASLPAGDRLFVVRSGTQAAWRNSYGEKHSKWLKDNL